MSRVFYIGNFEPEHSTENHILQALGKLGHEVTMIQEGNRHGWAYLLGLLAAATVDDHARPEVVMWTRTKSLSDEIEPDLRRAVLEVAASINVPTVGYHLDRWWGLPRAVEIDDDPFFRCSLLVTADGGHDEQWTAAGVNHLWMPPAVSEFECQPGTFDEAYASDIAFVGSWTGYHPEWWGERARMLEHVRSWYGDRFRCWPDPGQPAVRGRPLRDLYASVKVIVGDSCLVPGADGLPVRRYWSDRVPETIGRGGLLIHPNVEGLDEAFEAGEEGLLMWHLGDMDGLHGLIDFALERPDYAARMRERGRARVLEAHTYTVRMRQLWEHLGL